VSGFGSSLWLGVCLLSTAAVARAQSATDVLPGRYEVTAGASWVAPVSFGDSDATLTAASGGRYRLFSTSTALAAAPALDIRIGRRLTRTVQVELTASYSTPSLETTISNDVEGAAPAVASEAISQSTLGGAATLFLPGWRIRNRILPFVTGGGAYLVQLHEGRTLAEKGGAFHAGLGVMIPLVTHGPDRRVKQSGVRTDVRLLVRAGGVTLDGQAHAAPVVTASAFTRF